jgi:ribosomal protein S18 acetylase RimI-like enzyme
MIEALTVVDMGVEHIEIFGRMLAEMVAEAPSNYSITPAYAAEYGSGQKFITGMKKAVQENSVGRFVAIDGAGDCVGAVTTSQKDESSRIGNMYVSPAARVLGAGAMLLNACEQRAALDGYAHTSLVVGSTNHVARGFYGLRGYVSLDPPELEAWELHPDVYGETLIKILR